MIKTSKQLVDACIDVAKNYKTVYIWGGIGDPITRTNLNILANRYSKNVEKGWIRKAEQYLNDEKGYCFDCVCLIKSLLWGWCADRNHPHGGAEYVSNGVPDISANGMIKVCSEVTEDFTKIIPGEAVWCEGHIGIYIGDGLAVECTPSWDCGVQITAVSNIGTKIGYNTRKWIKHGKLPYITYEEIEEPVPTPVPDVEVESTNKNEKENSLVPVVTGLPELQLGMKNNAVRAAQELLKANNQKCGSSDGIFGEKTKKCVESFQREKNLQPTGIIEELTWTYLFNS